MDAKDLRTESALSERNNDGSKYSQSGGIALHCDRNKSYQDIGSNSLAKVDVQSARPCAVIGPDRVVPPSAPNEAYLKKGPQEPWPCMDNAYHTRRPPEYPLKLANYQNPTRNISPRQTFQENMQRIMVPPSYNTVKISDDTNYVQMSERSNALSKNIKINVPQEAKFCEVPYTVYPTNNEQKNVRNAEMCIPSVNPSLTRTAPHGWPSTSVNIRPTRTYGAPELYQYPQYSNCAGPRPVVSRPNRTVPEEQGYVYADPFYHQEENIRFKPYPTVKDRFPQQRYEYIGNYSNSFHPPPAFPTHKYELQKTVPPHPYPPYPPIKYVDRIPEPVIEGYQRNQQGSYNVPYRNQIIHPNYGPVPGNCPQNKIHSYPPDAHIKSLGPNKLPFDNTKAFIEYENGRPKMYPPSESYIVNEMGRVHPMKSQVIMPNYPMLNMHSMPPNTYYKKDNQQLKNYEYLQTHFRNMDPNINMHNPIIRHQPVFSPNTSAISPTESSASNDTSQNLGSSQEDCGYVSQSSTASARSIDSGFNRIPNDYLRKYYDSRYGPILRSAPMMSKNELISNNNSKDKKNIDVRQFLQMWNEGDEESVENNSKEIIIQSGSKSDSNFIKAHEVISQSNQEQLYVLGLVNVPSEELGKYEHIQKVSKLPENIKGYNHIELLNQFEEAIESSNMTNYKTLAPKDFQMASKVVPSKQSTGVVPPRPLSPLDVEAKISQSVIHKEVGCNFEIKPCSPKMLNVEVATPVQNILAERAIEKVTNPVMLKSPRLNSIDEKIDCTTMKRKEHRININNEPVRIPSCKMIKTQFSNNNNIDTIKNSYSLQDLESNSGLCLASLPRLDNDIELNFPEVNQQFINANKGDSSVSTSLRDLPSLELLDQSDNQAKDKPNDINSINQVNDILTSPSVIDTEKEFSKLSKYRKSKTHLSDYKENQTHVMSVINAARTDSVIIKNPENSKNYEEKDVYSPNCLNNQICTQQAPINLTSQGNVTEPLDKTTTGIQSHDAIQCKENNASVEIAIDFSLNKICADENAECVVIKSVEKIDMLTHNTVENNHSILDDNLRKLSTFSDCDQNIQDSFLDNKLYGNTVLSPIKCNNSEAVTEITKVKENMSIIEKPPLAEIIAKDKCILSVSDDKEAKDIVDDIMSGPNIEEISNVSSNSLLPLEFDTPAAELLQTDNDSSNFLMDVDKHSDVVETCLLKINNSLSDKEREDVLKTDDNNMDSNNSVTSIHEIVNAVVSAEAEDGKTNKIVDSELDIDACRDNVNQTNDSSVCENTQNIHYNNCSLRNMELFDHNPSQSYDPKQDPESSLDLSSPNNIVLHSRGNGIETNNQKTEYKSPALDSKVIQKSKDLLSIAIEQDSNLSSSSPKNIALLSPKEYVSEPDQEEPNSSSILLSKNDKATTNITDVTKSTMIETDIEFSLSCPNNIITHDSYDCQSKVTEQTSINSTSLNTTPEILKIDHTDTSQPLSNFNLLSPNSISNNDDITDKLIIKDNHKISILEEKSNNQIVVPSIIENNREDDFVNEVKDISLPHGLLELPIKRDKLTNRTNRGVRYLSYGSKEIYSPWIQKLLLYCEGNIKDNNLPNNCGVRETEQIEHICNVYQKDDNSTHNILHTNKNNLPPAFDKEISNTVNRSDHLMTEELVKSDANNICEADCKTNVDDNVNKPDKLTDTNPLVENDILISPIESTTDRDVKIIMPEILTESTLMDGINDKMGTTSDFEEIRHCLTPEVHERWDSRSISRDKTHGNWDNQSICSDDVPKQLDKQQDNVEYDQCDKIYDIKDEISEEWDKQFHCSDDASELLNKQLDKTYFCKELIAEQKDKQSNCSDDVPQQTDKNCNEDKTEQWEKQSNCSDEVQEQGDKPFDCSVHKQIKEQEDKQSNCSNDVTEEGDKQSDCSEGILEQWDKQFNCSHDELEQEDKQSNYSKDALEEEDKQSNCNQDILEQRDKQYSCSNDFPEQEDKQSNYSNDVLEEEDKQSNCSQDILEQRDKQYSCSNDFSEQEDKQSNYTNDVLEEEDKQSNFRKDILEQRDKQYNRSSDVPEQSNCDDDVRQHWEKQSNHCKDVSEQREKQSIPNDAIFVQLNEESDCNHETSNQLYKENNCNENKQAMLDKEAICSNIEVETSSIMENDELCCTKVQTSEHAFFNNKRQPLKRSLSDSALNVYNNGNENTQQESEENVPFIWPFKRRKFIHNDILAQDLCNIIQNNRRNSISAIYNEENVSFCILIDNGCIITEEENEEQEKICYTELSEECLAELQTESTKGEESIEAPAEITFDVSASQDVNNQQYSDSFIMQDSNGKLEASWVEDVACVETVISDDIAADIEISEPLSPKDDIDDMILSDNDESGVFSSSEHTDKVKYIYGDKMCNDDAQFVETLYNTPQMDVNKTLVQRENRISGEYYDNDSLEKILSESTDQEISPCVPEYAEPVFSHENVKIKETIENKENLKVIEMNSALEHKTKDLDVVDTNIERNHHENVKLHELFHETQDDTVHSCESSVDNVLAYKENNENTKYTSSSPEVSSTTSEEKKSAILLKITNYQGSRISQVNDIHRDSKRPSCKFTEDKDYVQSQSNFSTHRPLLTKAAQKYIPPLRESMRDLKVKLSLPQHSLMKLKQLKKSKDVPKVCKQNISVPRTSKKPKPKFEDVLKSIDEIQIKMHKEKAKKSKKSIPKVVIKKNENGSHYASTSNKNEFNPDLTGRKWQPWVFIEKNHFIDKMAMKKKTKAIFSHRKRTYVLAEKFQKYKSVNSAKFVISPPISDCPSAGLKYTIRLKHNY